ncbi:VCBS domain-containing protein [Rhodobacteraceae bacterium]|nr:VCBS domain-containing protein [Paracoccaceae bacterium]
MKYSRKFYVGTSPLGLLALSACGGGSGTTTTTIAGNAVLGPLQSAIAFVDYDGSGTLNTATEPYTFTDAAGAYSLASTSGTQKVVVTTNSATAGNLAINAIDGSSGAALTGVTLTGPSGATVLSPASTLLEKSSLTEAEVATALGLDGISLTEFNPYATGVDAANALAFEKVATQVITTVKAISAAAQGSGAAAEAASNAAFSSVISVVVAKATAGETLDLSDATDLGAIQTQAATDLVAVAGVDATAFTAVLGTTMTAVGVVNTQVKAITDTDLSASSTKGLFATADFLATQVLGAATAELALAGSGVADITLTTTLAVTNMQASAASNTAPSDLLISSSSFDENAAATMTFTGVDDSTTAFTFALSGEDAASFSINSATGVLTLTGTADFETKSTYSVIITIKDDAAVPLSYSEVFTLTVNDIDEAPTLTATGGALTEDSGSYVVSGTLAGVDPEGGSLTYNATTLSGQYGDLTLDSATGAYTYTMNNDNASVQALGADETLTETFSVSASDGSATTTESLSFTITGVSDTTLAAPTAGALTEDDSTTTVTGTLSGTDPEGDTLSYSIAGSIEVDGSYTATGTYGTLVVNKTTGAYTYTLDNTDADTGAIAAGTTADETFTVRTTDGTSRASQVLTITITGTNDTPVLTVPTGGALTEGASTTTVTDTLSASDAEAGSLTFSVVGETASSGVYTVTGTYGSISLNASTGAYTYTLNNSDADTVALTSADTGTETFTVAVEDAAGASATGSLSFAITGTGITITTVETDNKVNAAEAADGLTISGRGTAGETLTLTFSSGITLAAGSNATTVDSNGDWSIAATSADITGMGEGAETITATIGSNSSDPLSLSIDTVLPTTTVTGVEYDSANKQIVLAGTNFNTIAAAGADVKSVVDLTKVQWDLDGDASNAGITFAVSDITSAVVTSATVLTITLTDAAAAAMEATTGFAADGLGDTNTADKFQVAAGFAVDAAGNVATTDAAANLTPTYSDTTKPTVSSFTSTTADGSFKENDTVNITATMSEVVLDGSSITVTLDVGSTVVLTNSANSNTLTGTYTVESGKSSNGLSVSSFEVTSGKTVTDQYGQTLSVTTLPSNNFSSSTLVVDTTAPTNAITGVQYDGANNQIIFAGTNFTTIADASTDVKGSLDWSKLVWDLDADGATTAGITFDVDDVTSAIITSATQMTVTLTDAAAAAMEGTVGFAFDGIGSTNTADNVDVTAGFSVDSAGNAASTDGDADRAPTYTDGTKPTLASFSSTTANGAYKAGDSINITANMSETVLDGSAMSVTLGTGDAVTLTAGTNGTTLSGTYTISAGDSSDDLTVSSFAVTSAIYDQYGNTLSDTNIPANQNLDDTSALVVDTTAPTSEITGVQYDGDNNQIILAGSNFTTIASAGIDAKAGLDWSKIVWDLDGSSSNAGVTFALSDITSAVVTSATVFTITLTNSAAAALEGTVGFAADGLGDTNTPDNVDISAGFIRDAAGNAANSDAAADTAPTYTDGTKPTVASFSSTTADGYFKTDDTINITANMSEAVLDGAAIDATLGTGDVVRLTAATNGTTMSGTYTVSSGDSSDDLAVSSISVASSISDLYGNTLTNTSLPTDGNLSDTSAIVVDTTAPTSTITGVEYDSASDQIVLTGTKFTTIAASGTDVKLALDWSKLVWDLDSNAGNTGVTFSASDITSAVITSATVLTIQLTSTAAAAMESTVGFAADGLGATNTPDDVDVTAGFIKDFAGNAAATDAANSLSPSYSDSTLPTVTSFTSTTADGTYNVGDTINITATTSETILAGSSIKVTLDTGDEVTLTAASNGTAMTGSYAPSSGDTSTDLGISQAFEVVSAVTDTYGNALSVTSIPGSQNLSDNSALVIDTTPPSTTITAATYNSTDNTIVFTGTNFTTIAAQSTDVKSYLDWNKLVWDLDGDATDPGVSFAANDITSAVVTSATALRVTLTSTKASALESKTGFAADGLDEANAADQIDVAAGFTKDFAGNVSTTDGASNLAPSYSDTAKPTVTSFTSSKADGSYKSGDTINITANVSEAILGGSKLTATLGTADQIELTALQNGTTLVGTYTVSATDSSTDLSVSSFTLTDASGNSTSVSDVYGNLLTSTSMPANQNLSDNSAIVIDNIPIAAADSTPSASSADAGDSIALTFTEAVGNTSSISTAIGAATDTYGSSASTAWSNSNKTVTITLGSGEAVADGTALTISSVQDAAGNESDITFTLDIA